MQQVLKTVFVVLLLVAAGSAMAHQPRIVSSNTVEVKDPEVSQAFYAELSGKPQTYRISSKTKFRLYVQLTIPDLAGNRRDFTADISRNGKRISRLDGARAKWKKFHEPFSGGDYLLGPEYELASAEPGTYEVRVYNRDRAGKYVFVAGRKESFSLSDITKTMKLMPEVKKYMETPASSAKPKSDNRPGTATEPQQQPPPSPPETTSDKPK